MRHFLVFVNISKYYYLIVVNKLLNFFFISKIFFFFFFWCSKVINFVILRQRYLKLKYRTIVIGKGIWLKGLLLFRKCEAVVYSDDDFSLEYYINIEKFKNNKRIYLNLIKLETFLATTKDNFADALTVVVFFRKYYIPNYIWFIQDFLDLFDFTFRAYFFYRDIIHFFQTVISFHTMFFLVNKYKHIIEYSRQLLFYITLEGENLELDIIDEEDDDFFLDDLEHDSTDYFASVNYQLLMFNLKLSTFILETIYTVFYSFTRWIFKYMKYTLGRVTVLKFLKWHWRGYKQWNDIYRTWPDLPDHFEVLDLYA